MDDAATVSFAPFSKESMATINSKVKPGKQVSPPAWDVWQGCPALSAVLIRGFNVDSTNCFATRICTAADHAKQMKDELVPDLPRYPPPLLTLKSDTSPLQVLFMTYLPLSAPCGLVASGMEKHTRPSETARVIQPSLNIIDVYLSANGKRETVTLGSFCGLALFARSAVGKPI